MRILVIYLLTAAGFIALGVPLLLRAVPPNRWYGYRTRTTLCNRAIWYAVNRVTGAWMIVTGLATALVAAWTFAQGMREDQAALINMVPCIAGIVPCIVHGAVVIRRLTR